MSQATGLSPQQPQAPAPKKKGKGKWILLAVVVVVVIIAIATNTAGGKSSSSSDSGGGSSADSGAKTAGLNQPARDGKFEFTVTSVDCSKTTLGEDPITTKAQGVFCLVSLNVKNIGDEAQTLAAPAQYAYDAQGKKYSTDTAAEIYLGDNASTIFNQLNPGSSVSGQLVYDVPAGTQLTKIELHDSMFSGGVDVALG